MAPRRRNSVRTGESHATSTGTTMTTAPSHRPSSTKPPGRRTTVYDAVAGTYRSHPTFKRKNFCWSFPHVINPNHKPQVASQPPPLFSRIPIANPCPLETATLSPPVASRSLPKRFSFDDAARRNGPPKTICTGLVCAIGAPRRKRGEKEGI